MATLSNISLSFILNFIFVKKVFDRFRVNRSSRANEFFSGLAEIIVDQFQKQKFVAKKFLRWEKVLVCCLFLKICSRFFHFFHFSNKSTLVVILVTLKY